MNKTIIFSNETTTNDKNKTILIVIILFIIILLSLIVFLYIYIIMPQKRNPIIKNDINLEDIYQKENNKNVIVNPIVGNI